MKKGKLKVIRGVLRSRMAAARRFKRVDTSFACVGEIGQVYVPMEWTTQKDAKDVLQAFSLFTGHEYGCKVAMPRLT